MILASPSPLKKFMILAAAGTPPTLLALKLAFDEKTFCITLSNSFKASGWTVSRVAILLIMSAWFFSGIKFNTSEAVAGSKYEIIKAIIWGCSSIIKSATDLASSQSRISIALLLSDGVILPRTVWALSSPKDLVNTFLIYPPPEIPRLVCDLIIAKNSSKTRLTVSWPNPWTEYIAAPKTWTSFGVRFPIISAASSSPISIIRIAHFCVPVKPS